MIIFLDTLELAAEKIESAITLRLLMLLPRHLNFTEFRSIRQATIAEELKSAIGSISKGMAELLALGLVERKGSGPRQMWRLTTKWGWNGSADQYHAFRAGRGKTGKARASSGPQVVAEDILWKLDSSDEARF